jgi:hypothetical protein
MKLSRDAWLGIGLLIILMLVTVAAAIQQANQTDAPPYSSLSSDPDGTRALQLWLDELGYAVNDELLTTFELPQDAGLIFMLEPFPGITPEEWETLDAWVETGGVLVLAGDRLGSALAAYRYGFTLSYFEPTTATLTAQTPLWASPPPEPANPQVRATLQSSRDDFVTHLAVGGRPVLISFEQGEGRVILSAAPYPFSNAGLKEAGNPALVLNAISAAGQVKEIWFDEWHHGLRGAANDIVGPGNWLRYTPAGRSLLFIAAVIFVALLLQGRRFGRPVPLPIELSRRAPLEYITAVANLGRRAGHRRAVLSQYHHWLKRGLGQRYRLNPILPDNEYLQKLRQFNPNLDTAALANLLVQLNRKKVSESEMIEIAAQTADWLKESS